MTEEEIAEMKSALQAAQESIKALEKTNKDLKSEKAESKRKADEAEEARQTAADEAAAKSGDLETLRTSLEAKHQRELKKLQDANKTANDRLEKLTVDDAISSAVAKAGVLPSMVRAATLMLKDGVKFENGEATVNGVPFAEHISTQLASDDFAPFIAAASNTGAGARGSTTPGKSQITTLDELSALVKTDINAARTASVSPELLAVQKSLG